MILCWKLNSLRPRRNRHHFADDIFKRIFFNENVWISIKISLKFVPKGPINNIPALVQIMAWRRSGDKPLSEPMMVSLTTHIYVTRPQWVKIIYNFDWNTSTWKLSHVLHKMWYAYHLRLTFTKIKAIDLDPANLTWHPNPPNHLTPTPAPLMMTSSNWSIPITKASEWCGALMLSLIWDWTNHLAHYDVTIM